jgi:polyhydroxyalkanoate synthesis regulator phasin
LPALYFAVGMAQENIYKSKVDDLIKNKLEKKFHVISYKVDASNKNITLDVLSKKFDKNIDKDIENILKSEGLNTTKLKVYQSVEANYEATSDEINILKKEIQDLKNQINKK